MKANKKAITMMMKKIEETLKEANKTFKMKKTSKINLNKCNNNNKCNK